MRSRVHVVLVFVGVVLLVLSSSVILPPVTLTQVTLRCTERAVTVVTWQISLKVWPASVEPTEVTDTSGAGSAEEKNNGLQLVVTNHEV